MRDAARRAYAARVPGAVVADIVLDSLFDEPPGPPGTAAPAEVGAEPRRLRFAAADAAGVGAEAGRALLIDLTVLDRGPHLAVDLTLSPAQPARVEMRCANGGVVARQGPQGQVHFTLTSQLVSFLVTRADVLPVQTAWVRL